MVLINEIMGECGRFHIWICFLIFMNKFGVAFHQMAIIFLAPPTSYYCPDTTDMCCDNPVYNKTVFSRTIVMEWNLICGRKWLKDFTQTLFQFGVLSGSFFCGMLSDRYGRRPILISAVILEVFSGLMTSFLPDFWSFTIVRSILGFSIGGVIVVGFVIVMEYIGNTYRDTVSALTHVPFTSGYVLLALIGYLIRDYVYFQLFISASNAILLFYICVLPESPRWLLAVNRTSEAIDLLERVAKVNGLPVEEVRNKVECYQLEHKSRRDKGGTIIDLFRTPNIRKNIMIMSFTWFACSYYFYGVAHYISHLTGSVHVNVMATGSMCFCACFLAIVALKFTGRKKVIVIGNITCSACVMIVAVVPQGIVSTILGCFGILFSYTVFVVAYLFCSEMFPTVVRNGALGISSMMARVGAMIAPFVAGFRPYGKWCAPVAFGVMPLIAAVLCLWLPETKNCELMMTIEEGEAFGKKETIQIDNASAPAGIT